MSTPSKAEKARPNFAALAVYPYPFANLFGAVAPEPTKRARAANGTARPTIRAIVDELDAAGVPDALICGRVAEAFPESAFARDAKTAKRHLAWYRNDRKHRAAKAS